MSDRDTITLFGTEYVMVPKPKVDGPGYITVPKLPVDELEQWQQAIVENVVAQSRAPRAISPLPAFE
jgi:hypothetical protein